MKSLLLSGLMLLSICSFAQAQKSIGLSIEAKDANTVFDIISETQGYQKTDHFEIAELSNLKCSYSFVEAAQDNPRNAAICSGDTEAGRVILSQKNGALELYNILNRYAESDFSYGSSVVKVKKLLCTLDLVGSEIDHGDLHVKCAISL